MTIRRLVTLCGILLSALSISAHADELQLDLLPHGRPFRLTFADPREIGMGLNVVGSDHIEASVGNYFSLFSLKPKNSDDWVFHFGLEGDGYFTMRQADSRFPLETVDGLIGAYAEAATGPWQYQLRYTHISAHLADGSLTGPAIAYSREILITRVGYVFSPDASVYVGIHYLAHSVPELMPWSYQVGGEWFVPVGLGKFTPFTAADFQWGNDLPYQPSFNFELGIALNNPNDAYHSFRIFYDYYTGADPRGQFYNQEYTTQSIGIEMQI